MKACIVEVSRHFLGKMLQLPPGVRVRAMHVDPERDALLVSIEGLGPEVAEGGRIQEVEPTMHIVDTYYVDWTKELP